MTTIIIIIAVAVLAGLGSKMFLKDSSGLSDQGGDDSRSGRFFLFLQNGKGDRAPR